MPLLFSSAHRCSTVPAPSPPRCSCCRAPVPSSSFSCAHANPVLFPLRGCSRSSAVTSVPRRQHARLHPAGAGPSLRACAAPVFPRWTTTIALARPLQLASPPLLPRADAAVHAQPRLRRSYCSGVPSFFLCLSTPTSHGHSTTPPRPARRLANAIAMPSTAVAYALARMPHGRAGALPCRLASLASMHRTPSHVGLLPVARALVASVMLARAVKHLPAPP